MSNYPKLYGFGEIIRFWLPMMNMVRVNVNFRFKVKVYDKVKVQFKIRFKVKVQFKLRFKVKVRFKLRSGSCLRMNGARVWRGLLQL